MKQTKHVGRIVTTGRKCLVAFRTIPGDAYNCLVIPTENLSDEYHDALINLVESPSGQNSYEFAEVLNRTQFPDGSTMLPSLHAKGKIVKVATDAVEMIPNSNTKILLSELNQLMAEQRSVPVDELSIKDFDSAVNQSTPLNSTKQQKTAPAPTPEEQAKKYRSEADRLSKEAANYRRLADELVPPTKRKRAKPVASVENANVDHLEG